MLSHQQGEPEPDPLSPIRPPGHPHFSLGSLQQLPNLFLCSAPSPAPYSQHKLGLGHLGKLGMSGSACSEGKEYILLASEPANCLLRALQGFQSTQDKYLTPCTVRWASCYFIHSICSSHTAGFTESQPCWESPAQGLCACISFRVFGKMALCQSRLTPLLPPGFCSITP